MVEFNSFKKALQTYACVREASKSPKAGRSFLNIELQFFATNVGATKLQPVGSITTGRYAPRVPMTRVMIADDSHEHSSGVRYYQFGQERLLRWKRSLSPAE